MKHAAWLSAVPQHPPNSDGKPSKRPANTKSRAKRYRETHGCDPQLPPLEWGQHIIGMWAELGRACYDSQGPTPLTFAEMRAWQQMTGRQVTAWEATTLRDLSEAYCSQLARSTKHDCPPPWMDPDAPRADVSDMLDRALQQREESRKNKR